MAKLGLMYERGLWQCFVIVLLSVLSLTSASTVVLASGACPNPGAKPDFNISKFWGTWYEYESFDRSQTSCIAAHYSDNGNGTTHVVNEGFMETKRFGRVTHRTRIHALGKVHAPNPRRPAEMKLSFGENTDNNQEPNYIVVDTDYTSYAVVFSCSQIPRRPLHLQGAWIITRDQGVAPANLNKLKENLAAKGIKVNSFTKSSQSNCSTQSNSGSDVTTTTAGLV